MGDWRDKTSARKALQLALDRALRVQRPLVISAIARQRRRRPQASPADILGSLEKQYLAAMTGSGAAVGGAAAAPGVGTGAALALSAGETVAFLEASALFTLATAEIHGLRIDDLERRRTLFLAIVIGDSGAKLVEKAAGRSGKYWGRLIVDKIPMSSIRRINKVLGRWFVTKYGTKQGIVVLGRLVPFGVGAAIGGAGNALFARTVIGGARRAFGPPPSSWPPQLLPAEASGPAQGETRRGAGTAGARKATGQRPAPPSGKYAPLYTTLKQTEVDVVAFTFDELDAMVGGLPPSAWTQRAWWTNGSGRTQARSWLAAGFMVTEIDLDGNKVIFAR